MELRYEWDAIKAADNLLKHGVHFDEGTTVFTDPLARTIPDTERHDEFRFVTIGMSAPGHLLVVIHTERDGKIRLIMVRRATPRERRTYEEENDA